MKPKCLALSLIFSLLFTSNAGAVFNDYDPDSEFNDAIDYVSEHDIVDGYDDGSFKENQSINRAEFTKIIINAAVPPDEIYGDNCFDDVSDEWYAGYVCTAQRYNIVSGYGDKTFKPGEEISFVEAAKILSRGFNFGVEEGVNIWYEPFVEDLAFYRIIPSSIKTLDKKINRGEMVEMIWRIMAVIEDRSYADYQDGRLIAVIDPSDPIEYQDDEFFVYEYADEESTQAEYIIQETENAILNSGTATARQEEIIEWIFGISDDEVSNDYLGKIIFYEDASTDVTAYVLSNDIDTGKFGFYVNLGKDIYGDDEMLFTLVHEYAHLLSLNDGQVDPYVSESDCKKYYFWASCLVENAYLNLYYEEFWEPYPDDYGFDAESRYADNPSNFVTEYAATEPAEDFAESFAYYMTHNSPNQIADKYNFFDSFPELVSHKSKMQEQIPALTGS